MHDVIQKHQFDVLDGALTLGVLSASVCGSPPPQAAAPHNHALAIIHHAYASVH
jgi:hypothetical protein